MLTIIVDNVIIVLNIVGNIVGFKRRFLYG